MQYRREIDGLRALAVIPVILCHAGFKIFGGGFVGVDVFFVISGYLITTIILKEKTDANFSIIGFYERRARRILPALFCMMFVCMPFAFFWLLPRDMKDFSQSLVAVSAFISNILFWQETNYFASASELKPLLHTWSLAVEEQFYLFFPLFLMFIWRYGKKWIGTLLAAATIASLAISHWAAFNHPSANFYLLPTRAWELAIGSLIGVYFSIQHKPTHNDVQSQCGSITGFLMIMFSIFVFDGATPFPSLYALIPTIGAALVIFFATPLTYVGRLLGSRLFVGIGLISYSAYLWHQPLFAFARYRSPVEPGLFVFAILSVVALFFAYISWRYIEQPFRSKTLFSRSKIFTMAVLGSGFFIMIGLMGHFTNGYYFRSALKDRIGALEPRLRNNHGLSESCDREFTLSSACRTSDEPEVLVWGDSYAMHLVPGLLASKPRLKLIQMTVSDCGPILDIAPVTAENGQAWSKKCIATNDKVLEWLVANKAVKYVVLSSPFDKYVNINSKILYRNGEIADSPHDVDAYLRNTLEKLKSIGVIPIVFSPPPRNGDNFWRCISRQAHHQGPAARCNFSLGSSILWQQDVISLLKSIEADYKVVWLSNGICSNGTCQVEVDGNFIYRDDGHLSYEGSAFLGKQMNFYHLLTMEN